MVTPLGDARRRGRAGLPGPQTAGCRTPQLVPIRGDTDAGAPIRRLLAGLMGDRSTGAKRATCDGIDN
jgi:hypothetical protein